MDAVRRIPSLDGLRAVAVALVVLAHLSGTRWFPLPARVIDEQDPGGLGVRIFFVISGFLISRILFDELGATGRIRLARFYVRRTLRIFPPYYAFLLALALLAAAGQLRLVPGDLLISATYTSNYFPWRSWRVSHTWSLAVEEQFYLLWPALLIWLGRRRALVAAAAFVGAAPLIRVSMWLLDPALEPAIRVRSETIADAIAVGCLLAGLGPWLHRQTWYRALLSSRAVFVIALVIVAAHELLVFPLIDFGIGYSLVNIGIAVMIDRLVTYPAGRVGRVLNSRPLVTVGVMSYSVYLWQQLFLDRQCGSLACAFPLNLVVVLAAAAASFYLVERPALALRYRLEGRWFGAPKPAPSPETRPNDSARVGALSAP